MRIHRSLYEAVHETQITEVLHMDWIHIMPRGSRMDSMIFHWNLIVREELTGMIEITLTHKPYTAITVEALMK